MNKDAEVLEQLKAIIDPDLGKDIVTLGFIKGLTCDEGDVSFTIELTTPACPVKDEFRRRAEELVGKLPWVTSVTVIMSAQKRSAPALTAGPGLKGVENIIAVSSCKGGVGKSTVAVNLAYSLQKLGAKVGIFDADVYGPSLPTMVSPPNKAVFQTFEGLLAPLEYKDAKLMSFGYVSGPQGGGPAIMRGPMVTQVINQLLTTTDWGDLDYLVLDLPPGTGDIQLTLTQLIPITAAVIVTTPQELSFVDVVKGIQMFDKLKVPVVGVVENMSYFVCTKCSEKHYVFGQGARRRLVEQFGIQNSFEIPINPEISRMSDNGTPVALSGSELAQHYATVAQSVVREVAKLKHGGLARPKVVFNPGRGIVVTTGDGKDHIVKPADLRRACRCAVCVEEFSGKQILKPETIPDNIYPKTIQAMGNYAVAVTWSDDHASSIYPYDVMLKLAT